MEENDKSQDKKTETRSKFSWWRVLLWVVLSPIILFAVAVILLYLPPVQRWAVDKASEWLSEETGMEISVGSVRLSPFFDFEMGDMLAVSHDTLAQGIVVPDTVLDARRLGISLRLLPLLKGQAEIDEVSLTDARLNTRDMIDAALIRGNIGHLHLDAHSVDLSDNFAHVTNVSLSDADLYVALADSVPEDTTESSPVLWKIGLEDVNLERVRARVLLSPQADSVMVGATIGTARLNGLIDLADEVYNFKDIELSESAVTYDMLKEARVPEGFDTNHIAFSDLTLNIPNARYEGSGGLNVVLDELKGKEQSGLELTHTSAEILMDESVLQIPRFVLQTPSTDLSLSTTMDLNAFDSDNPGTLKAQLEGHVGRYDMALFAAPYLQDMFSPKGQAVDGFQRAMPPASLNVKADVEGNMKRMRLNTLEAGMLGHAHLKADGVLCNLNDSTGGMRADVAYTVNAPNLQFVKNFVPADARQSFNIPQGIALRGNAQLNSGRLNTTNDIAIGSSHIRLGAGMGMDSEDYDVALHLHNLNVGQFVPLEQPINLTGELTARGHGFDPFVPTTRAEASLSLTHANMGQIDLSDSQAKLQLLRGIISADIDMQNEQIQTSMAVNGKLQREAVDAHVDLNLPLADLYAMGMSDETFELSTAGSMDVYSNLDTNFRVRADINQLSLLIGDERINTSRFDMLAETTRDTTNATLRTGDLYFDFHAPDNLFALVERFQKIGDVANRQLEQRSLDVNTLKSYFPESTLRAEAGTHNPITQLLGLYGVSFNELRANLATDTIRGLVGDAHVYHLKVDTLSLDTIYFDLKQDSAQFAFRGGVACGDQPLFSGFSAHLDGYASVHDADMRLTFFNLQHEQGLDLGLHALIGDSVLDARLYPEMPIIGFRHYRLNDDNYLRLGRKNRMSADIRLTAVEDSSSITLTANPADSLLQDIRAIVKNLELENLMAVVPGAPKLKGLFSLDANFQQTDTRFWVKGNSDIRRFDYEGTQIGDVGTVFDYAPIGNEQHSVMASLLHNGRNVARVRGEYDGTGDGSLDALVTLTELPLSMTAPFIPDQIVTLDGTIDGELTVRGPLDRLDINGELQPNGMKLMSELYSLNMHFADEPFFIRNSRISFEQYKMYGTGEEPLTLTGWVDFANTDNIQLNLSLYGRDFELLNAPRTRRALLFGKMFGNFFLRMNGTLDDLKIRGLIRVLSNTDLTYVMADTPLSVDYRLEDIVTFVDFRQPLDEKDDEEKANFVGLDMQVNLTVDDGAQFHCEFSADRQSYVNVQGGGSLVLNSTPEGVLRLLGRYTINEGEMKYTLPIIPLKTFTIEPGSYVEFTGEPMNPTINFAASERTKATVTDESAGTRSVTFDAGLKVTGSLEQMQLLFTIDAPEDMAIKNELAGMSAEEKNKLAVGLLCTGMYMAASNASSITASNALNNFLQNEINNIAGQAFASAVDVNVGMEQSTRDDGTTRTDYSFKFSKRFFSNRLNVVIGGRVNADGSTQENESGAYIDNVSLEYRLDNGGTRYVRLYHEKNYDNLIEGELTENGASIVLRKKLDSLSELMIWRKNKQ